MFAPLPLAAALLLAAPPPDSAAPDDAAPAPVELDRVAGRTAEQWADELSDENRVRRCRAALSLRAFGPAAAPHLAGALRNDDEAVRFWAAEGLGMTPDAPAARESTILLRTLALDGATAERLAAAFALGKLGETDAAVPVLVAGLGHPSRGVAVTAADFLARLGPAAAPAADALREAKANHGDYHVRYRAAQALAAATGEAPDSEGETE